MSGGGSSGFGGAYSSPAGLGQQPVPGAAGQVPGGPQPNAVAKIGQGWGGAQLGQQAQNAGAFSGIVNGMQQPAPTPQGTPPLAPPQPAGQGAAGMPQGGAQGQMQGGFTQQQMQQLMALFRQPGAPSAAGASGVMPQTPVAASSGPATAPLVAQAAFSPTLSSTLSG